MKLADIRRMAGYIPVDHAPLFTPEPFSPLDARIRHQFKCENDPAFGWYFAKHFAKARESLHYAAQDFPWIRHAYNVQRFGNKLNPRAFENNEPTATAISWQMPEFYNYGIMVKGLLLAPDATVEKIAELTNLNIDAIRAYEQLFFNVLDRKADTAYLCRLVYPNGIISEILPDHHIPANLETQVLSAGYKNGMKAVMHLMGARGMLEHKSDDATSLEREIMANANFYARNGGLNQNHPAVQQGRQLLAAAKKGSHDAGMPVADPGGPTSLGSSLVISFMEMAQGSRQSDLDRRNGAGTSSK